MPTPLHFVLRDLHSQNILFDGQRLSGFIDLGAARVDLPLLDLVRMLGSLIPHDAPRRHQLLDQYLQLIQPQATDGSDLQTTVQPERPGQIALVAATTSWTASQDWPASQMHQHFAILDQVSTLLSAMQWCQWLTNESRLPDIDPQQAISRWLGFIRRLDQDQW
jgi:aminoglycoside phosphotransferase (APT) family kinase protein